MDLPQTVHPSRLSPHFVRGYLIAIVGVPVLAGATWFALPSLEPWIAAYGIPPVSLYAVAVLPLLKLVWTEAERRRYAYEFHENRVKVRRGRRTVRQEDVAYEKITDISSVTPPFEGLVDVGDLRVHLSGTDKTVELIGVKHPDRYEELMMGRTTGTDTQHKSKDPQQAVSQELQELEARYQQGEIGRAEYEQRYYYLQGKQDAYQEREEG